MYDNGVGVLSQYGLTAITTCKGRGAMLCETETGWKSIQEFGGARNKLELQCQLHEQLMRSGAALCGWNGVRRLLGHCCVTLSDEDLFPKGTVTMNGMKMFNNFTIHQVVGYTYAVLQQTGCGLEPVFHDPVLQFFYRKSFRLFFQRFCHKKSFSHGCAQSICADDFPLRIFLPQIIHAQPGSLVGSRHSGGKAQIEDISSFCQIRFQILQIDCRIDLRSGAKLSASLQSVKFFRCDRSGRTVRGEL